jgi:hypothetical protein
MNTAFLVIIKRIVSEQGESILADPARLKAFFGDLAKDEPKPLRIAFGRCIEAGAYTALKDAPDAAERVERKAAIAQRQRDEHGLDITLCGEAMDILEAALFGIPPQPQTPPPVYQTQPQAYQAQTARTSAPAKSFTVSLDAVPGHAGIADKITRRTFIYAAATGLPWLLPGLISSYYAMPWLVLVIPVGISFILKFTATVKLSFWRYVTIALCEYAGFILLSIPLPPTDNYPLFVSASVGIGALLGIVSVLYFPNYPPWRALFAGALGGFWGVLLVTAVCLVLNPDDFFYLIEGNLFILLGIWGIICGFTISFVEEASRKAWLTITRETGKKISVALGKKPISFGSSKEALVRLPCYTFDQQSPGISAVFTREYDGRVFVRDCSTGALEQLANGSRIDLQGAGVVVHITG